MNCPIDDAHIFMYLLAPITQNVDKVFEFFLVGVDKIKQHGNECKKFDGPYFFHFIPCIKWKKYGKLW